MSKYTINDVAGIIDIDQTPSVIAAVEDYLNNGTIPPYDPCMSCEPQHIRKLIGSIQAAQKAGVWPPKKVTQPERDVAKDMAVAGVIGEGEVEKARAGSKPKESK